jgi:large subunit ribosomal protein L24
MTARAVQRPTLPEIRKGDTIVVLSGRDAGKRGTVDRIVRRAAAPGARRSVYRRVTSSGGVYVVVDGVNVVKRHTKPRQRQNQSDRMPRIQQGGILDIAAPLPISKVMLVCRHCDRPTRVRHETLESGRRIRVCRNCGEAMEVTSK